MVLGNCVVLGVAVVLGALLGDLCCVWCVTVGGRLDGWR